MSKINNVEQLTPDDLSKADLRLISSIKHRVKETGGFGEINVKFTVKNHSITNAKYTRIDESENLC